MTRAMLTTTDNPFNPFTQFDDWQAFDEAQGYNTCGYLARIAVVSDSLSPEEYDQAIEDAMDEILALNVLGIYKKITNENADASG